MRLPSLPPVEVKKHMPTEVMAYATEYGDQCAKATLVAVTEALEQEFQKLSDFGMYIQAAGIRLGIDAIKRLEEK